MFEQFFMPLERHFDGGFHATGDAFKAAAEKLSENPDRMGFASNAHLPINYLYRHAIELYLKSMVLILTRVIEKSNVPLDPTKVKVQVHKDKPLTSVHSLNVLRDELQRLVTANANEIARLTPRDWNVPQDVRDWIDTIEQHDAGSTFSRYPSSKSVFDDVKSSFQPVELETLTNKMNEKKTEEKGQIALLMKNDDGEIVEAFSMQEEILPELRKALVEAATALSGAAFGFQAELVEGYGWKTKKWSEDAQKKREADTFGEEITEEEAAEPKIPDFEKFFEPLNPHFERVVVTERERLGVDPILLCIDTTTVKEGHQMVVDLIHKHGPTSLVQLSETLFCLPVSNQQLSESVQEYINDTLKEAVSQTAEGIWLMYCEDKSICLQRGALQEGAE